MPHKPYKSLMKALSPYKYFYNAVKAQKFLNHIAEAFSIPSFTSFTSIE
jgi:hypothetical protein